MKLEDLLSEYGTKKGIGKFELNETGICRFIVNETTVVSFEKSLDGKGFYIYAVVCTVPPEREKEIAVMALSGNLFRRETGEANLGYIPSSNTLVLFEYVEEYATTFPLFEKKFHEFTQYLAYWIAKIGTRSSLQLEEISLQKHVIDLPEHRKMKIFFA